MTATAPSAAASKFVPPFLAKLGVQPGQWVCTSKLSLRALMRPTWPLKVRIWACLMLQAFGYGRDLAVVMQKATRPEGQPKIKPITPNQIARLLDAAIVESFKESKVALCEHDRRELLVSKQHLRRALEDMEADDGLIVRVRANVARDTLADYSLDEAIASNKVTPLANLSGKVLKRVSNKGCVYLLAKPRPAANQKVAINGYLLASKPIDTNDSSQLFLPFLSKGDRALAPAIAANPEALAALESFERAKAELQATVNRLIAAHHEATPAGVPAHQPAAEQLQPVASPIHHEESHEGKPADQSAGVPPLADSSPRPSAATNPKGDGQRKGPPANTEPAAPVAAEVVSPVDVEFVYEAMTDYCPFGCDFSLVRELIRKCRAVSPHCTTVAIREAIGLRGPMARHKHNPPGFLLTAVPRLMECHQIHWPASEKQLQIARAVLCGARRGTALEAQRYDAALRLFLDKRNLDLLALDEREWVCGLLRKTGLTSSDRAGSGLKANVGRDGSWHDLTDEGHKS